MLFSVKKVKKKSTLFTKAIMKILLALLRSHHLSISCAESITGGNIAKCITETAGISEVFAGGIVCYSIKSKIQILKISPKTLDLYGVYSKETAIEMAENTKKIFETDVSITTTGSSEAGEENPKGHVFIAIALLEKTHVFEKTFTGSRIQIQEKATKYALEQTVSLLLHL